MHALSATFAAVGKSKPPMATRLCQGSLVNQGSSMSAQQIAHAQNLSALYNMTVLHASPGARQTMLAARQLKAGNPIDHPCQQSITNACLVQGMAQHCNMQHLPRCRTSSSTHPTAAPATWPFTTRPRTPPEHPPCPDDTHHPPFPTPTSRPAGQPARHL